MWPRATYHTFPFETWWNMFYAVQIRSSVTWHKGHSTEVISIIEKEKLSVYCRFPPPRKRLSCRLSLFSMKNFWIWYDWLQPYFNKIQLDINWKCFVSIFFQVFSPFYISGDLRTSRMNWERVIAKKAELTDLKLYHSHLNLNSFKIISGN